MLLWEQTILFRIDRFKKGNGMNVKNIVSIVKMADDIASESSPFKTRQYNELLPLYGLFLLPNTCNNVYFPFHRLEE